MEIPCLLVLVWVGFCHLAPRVPSGTEVLPLMLFSLIYSIWQPYLNFYAALGPCWDLGMQRWIRYSSCPQNTTTPWARGCQMLLLLFSRTGNWDSERLKDFAQGHSFLVAEPRKEPQWRIFYREHYFTIGVHSWWMRAWFDHKSQGLPLSFGIQ